MTVWQHMILSVPKPPELFSSPVIEGRVTVDDLRDLAAVKALSAAALPWFSFAMEHPDFTERLPCVLARPEGALRFSSGIL